MKGHVMSERGLAKRDRHSVLQARSVGDMADGSDEMWPRAVNRADGEAV